MTDSDLKTARSALGADLLRGPIFVVRGPSLGPRLVVTGRDRTIRALADRLWNERRLRDLRGSLVLRADGQDPAFDLPDVILALDHACDESACHEVLQRMISLGMIAEHIAPGRHAA